MFSTLHTLILAIVEGITEFLPISSTGHMVLTAAVLHIPETEFVKSFQIIIQLGAIAAVLMLYWRSLLVNFEVLKRVIVGFIPTGIIGLLLYKVVKQYLLGNVWVVLGSLFVGGLVIIIFEKFHHEPSTENETVEHISYKHAALIGLFQTIAIIPGVSRSAATIVGGLILGYKRKTIVEFSFLLAVPTMLAATGLDLLKNGKAILAGGGLGMLALGFVVAFVVALAAVKWLLGFVQKHTFIWFGMYRILVAIVGFFLLG